MLKLKEYIRNLSFLDAFVEWTKRTTLKGFDNIPLYYIIGIFFKELRKEAINQKAASLAFSFLLAIFPGIIFLFTLIAYIPIDNFQVQLISLLGQILPNNVFRAMQETLEEIITRQRGDLLSIGFATSIYFSTNGIATLMRAFNKSSLQMEKRPWWKVRLLAIGLAFSFTLFILVGIVVLVIGQYFIGYLSDFEIVSNKLFVWLLYFTRWFIIIFLFFGAISMLYYFGPATPKKFKFISPGSILCTILFILTSVAFSYYINNFGTYNKIYGSIGTLIVVMLWLYISSIIILIGFEVNASIHITKKHYVKPNTLRDKSQT
jgi:membrane protein